MKKGQGTKKKTGKIIKWVVISYLGIAIIGNVTGLADSDSKTPSESQTEQASENSTEPSVASKEPDKDTNLRLATNNTAEPTVIPAVAPTPPPTIAPTPTPTVAPTPPPTEAPTPEPTAEPQPDISTPQSTEGTGSGAGNNNFDTYDNPDQQQTEDTYVLNTNSMKIHHPGCSSVAKIAPQNYSTSNESIADLQAKGYSTCQRCFK